MTNPVHFRRLLSVSQDAEIVRKKLFVIDEILEVFTVKQIIWCNDMPIGILSLFILDGKRLLMEFWCLQKLFGVHQSFLRAIPAEGG